MLVDVGRGGNFGSSGDPTTLTLETETIGVAGGVGGADAGGNGGNGYSGGGGGGANGYPAGDGGTDGGLDTDQVVVMSHVDTSVQVTASSRPSPATAAVVAGLM